MSPYVYCSNNPINRIDPDGRDDYFNEEGKWLYTDTRSTTNLRTLSNESWTNIQGKHGIALADTETSNLNLIKALDANSKVITIEDAGGKFANMWSSSMSSGNETAGVVVFDFENAKITFEVLNVQNASSTGGYIPYKAGDKYNNSDRIVLGNVHTHPTEHTYLGKRDINGNVVTDQYNFNHQYSDPNADGNRAAWQGANYTISKYNVDYFSPKGKASSINNFTTRRNLERDGTKLLKHSLLQYGKN